MRESEKSVLMPIRAECLRHLRFHGLSFMVYKQRCPSMRSVTRIFEAANLIGYTMMSANNIRSGKRECRNAN